MILLGSCVSVCCCLAKQQQQQRSPPKDTVHPCRRTHSCCLLYSIAVQGTLIKYWRHALFIVVLYNHRTSVLQDHGLDRNLHWFGECFSSWTKCHRYSYTPNVSSSLAAVHCSCCTPCVCGFILYCPCVLYGMHKFTTTTSRCIEILLIFTILHGVRPPATLWTLQIPRTYEGLLIGKLLLPPIVSDYPLSFFSTPFSSVAFLSPAMHR